MKQVKINLFFALMMLSAGASADVFINKAVYDVLETQQVVKTDAVIEAIVDLYPYYGLGDDGIDCPVEVTKLVISKKTADVLEFTFESQQDYVGSYGCMSWPMYCKVLMDVSVNTTDAKCDI